MTELGRWLHDVAAVYGDFKLRSGASTNLYLDKYRFENDPRLLREVARAMATLLPPDAEGLGALELGGVPIATVISQETGLRTWFVRKHAKAYGTCQQVEGGEVSGLRIVIVEDIVTSGGAISDGTGVLRSAGAMVDCAICAIDREEGARARLQKLGVELRPAFVFSAQGSVPLL